MITCCTLSFFKKIFFFTNWIRREKTIVMRISAYLMFHLIVIKKNKHLSFVYNKKWSYISWKDEEIAPSPYIYFKKTNFITFMIHCIYDQLFNCLFSCTVPTLFHIYHAILIRPANSEQTNVEGCTLHQHHLRY